VNTATNTPTSTATRTPTATPAGLLCADVNGDGRVNAGDVLRVALRIFFHRPYEARYDINRDGVINVADLIAVIRQFGQRCRQ